MLLETVWGEGDTWGRQLRGDKELSSGQLRGREAGKRRGRAFPHRLANELLGVGSLGLKDVRAVA